MRKMYMKKRVVHYLRGDDELLKFNHRACLLSAIRWTL